MSGRYSSLTTALLIGAFAIVLQGIIFPYTLIGGDEGRYAQDAMRLVGGEWPIADFTTRTPLLLMLIAFSVQLFGVSIITLKLPLLLVHALTCVLMYIVGREYFSERIGRIAGILYGSIPYTLWNGALMKSESLAILFMLGALYAYSRAIRGREAGWLIIAGVFVGAALVERLSAVIVVGVVGMMMVFDSKSSPSERERLWIALRRGSIFSVGIILGFAFVTLPLFLRNAQSVATFYFSPFLLDAVTGAKEVSWTLLGTLRIWGIVLTETIAVQAWVLFPLFLIFCVGAMRLYFPSLSRTVMYVPSILLGAAFLVHTGVILYYGTYHPEVFPLVLASTGIFLGVLVWSMRTNTVSFVGKERGIFLIIMWMIMHGIAYSFFLPGYSRELIPPLVFAAAVVIDAHWVIWQRSYMERGLLVLAAVGLWGAGVIWYQNPRVGGWWWSQETMRGVAGYVRENTTPGERIFAANPLPVVLAGRRTVLDMNPYAIVLAPNSDTSWGSFASPNAYYQALVERPPKYTIVDGRMEGQYFSLYPMFKTFIQTQYHPVETFWTGERRGKVEIWERNNPASLNQ